MAGYMRGRERKGGGRKKRECEGERKKNARIRKNFFEDTIILYWPFEC